MEALPSGDVTFVFVDVVGSTRLFQEYGEAFVAALARLQACVAEHVHSAGGVVVKTQGDGAFAAFSDATAALAAVTAVQRASDLDRDVPRLELRAGAHRGPAVPLDGDYVALAVHVAARICGAAHAGQVLVSDAVAAAVAAPRDEWVDFGDRVLRDIAAPVRVWLVHGPAVAPSAPSVRRTNIARPHTSFVGREHLVGELEDRLSEPCLVTLVGPGGLGKTRLASEVGLRMSERLPGGAWLVELAGVDRPENVPDAIANVLGVHVVRGDPVGAVASTLRDRGMSLLILDNCEQVIDAAARVANALLLGVPDIRVLCTSREPLGLPTEQVVRPEPLTDAPNDGSLSAAARLFADRARSAGREMSETDFDVVEQLCRDLDGLPLAVELAASRAADMPLPALARLAGSPGEHPEVFVRRGGENRHRTLDAVVAWSDGLLPAPERTTLRVLSAFPGGFSTETADWTLGILRANGVDVAPRAWPLARRSLLDVNGDRFRMLHTIRSLANDWLVRTPDLAAVAETAVLNWADHWSRSRETAPSEARHRDVRAELPNLLAAVTIGVARHSDLLAAPLKALQPVLLFDGVPPSLRKSLEIILDWEDERLSTVRAQVLAIRLTAGLVKRSQHVPVARIRRWVEVGDASGDPDLQAQFRTDLATLLPLPAEADLARTWLIEAEELTRGDERLQSSRSRAMLELGFLEHVLGNPRAAVPLYDTAITSLEPGDCNLVVAYSNKAEALLDLELPVEALPVTQQAMAALDGQPSLTAYVTGLAGEAYVRLGHREPGRGLLTEAVQRLTELAAADPSVMTPLDRFHAILIETVAR